MKNFLIRQWIFSSPYVMVALDILRIFMFLVSISTSSVFATSNSIDSLQRKALQFESTFRENLALECYLKIIAKEPNNVDALVKASRLYSRIGGRKENGPSKKDDILRAKSLSLTAIQFQPNNVDAHFQYIIAMGLLSEMASSPREKLENARIIKKESDLVLSLDNDHAGAHFILGKWNQSLASLSWMERLACDALFGGVPEGASFTEATRHFERAIELEPTFILFRFSQAKLLYHQGKYAESLSVLKTAMQMPESEPDDIIRKENCKRLLFDLQHNLQNPKQ